VAVAGHICCRLFVWRCLSGSTMNSVPHPAHRTGHADSRIRLSTRPHAFAFRVQRICSSEPVVEFNRLPPQISPGSSPPYCVCLELRPLPSAHYPVSAVTRTLSAPKAPGLSLAGSSLVIALTTPWGFPCCVRFPCVHARHSPAQRLGLWFRSVPSRVSLPRKVIGSACASSFSRLARVHSRYGLHTRVSQFVTRFPKASATSSPP